MNLSSLCGKNEQKNTNNKAGITSFRTRSSKYKPIGTKNMDAAIPLGIAE